jgi:peptidoglycan-associated lipoprotein
MEWFIVSSACPRLNSRLFLLPGTKKEMNINILGAFAAVALLAACAEQQTATTTGSGTSTSAGPAAGSQEDLVANVGDRVFYDYNMSSLRRDGQETLGRQAAWLAKYPNNQVQIAGNCDERGTTEYNLALGQRRANAAASYLRAKGVAAARMTTISYGKDRPTAMGSEEQAWAQNRNAVTSVR